MPSCLLAQGIQGQNWSMLTSRSLCPRIGFRFVGVICRPTSSSTTRADTSDLCGYSGAVRRTEPLLPDSERSQFDCKR